MLRVDGLYFCQIDSDNAQYFKFYVDGQVKTEISNADPQVMIRYFGKPSLRTGSFECKADELTISFSSVAYWRNESEGLSSAAGRYTGRVNKWGLDVVFESRGGKYRQKFYFAEVADNPVSPLSPEYCDLRSDSRRLIGDLIKFGEKVPDRYSSSNYRRAGRTPEIGIKIYELGGLGLMLAAHAEVRLRLGSTAARELESAWDGIGEWQN